MSKTSTRFFTVILPSTIIEQKLRIPKSFIVRFRHELSNVATLQVRNNADSWKIKLVEIGGDLYFKEGWHRFLRHHSIEESFFLVFDYLRNSSFDVVIFDRYNTQVHFGEQMENDADADVDEDNEEDEDENDDYYDEEVSIEIWHSTSPPSRKNKYTSSKKQGIKISKMKSKSYACSSMRKHDKKARKEEFRNPSLTVTLKPYNVRPGCYLNVPAHFAKECTKRCPKFMTIQNTLDGSKFLVSCVAFSWRKITKGWVNFVRKNDLHEGDVCVFEFMQGSQSVVQVTITRTNQGARS